ncbi:MAG: hypothetical protein A2204_04455 [Elusimicrobia bacterium RIFOXYA1_FULL_47_7]|nr:MAG: hypothetical protein A2204_04455 [Elusimicrobia bacterium RIFOXYA1_FULL_47_7]OGS10408.1 MAG: hypothetical protein A2386_07145 [Elusimicrobia bacterium RIFOXYB1_FULL_48_9]OGS16713.1 MAG: hypothetical protein A2251_00840 [Elusimicrobia bacterium RIFOXYA2_FULL_47_53]OGS26766.1 MAG: hypothetical protein A2339_04095 [Elusimicrobia bacterium RIFOXYB12_FULL_50_12]OGS31672.1 MAG: hypothetical protein A2323_05670 [Elusimicrobia bacterium RIFOXYB2_FULL_46_23]
MELILISLFSGIAVYFIATELLRHAASLKLEKQVKEKTEAAKGSRQIKGLTGTLIFFSEKIGEIFKSHKYRFLDEMAAKSSASLSILSNPSLNFDGHTFLGIQFFAGLGAVIFFALLMDMYNFIILCAVFALGFYAPVMLLESKVKEKHKSIFRQIPDCLDLLTLMMEAGIDFSAALNKLIESEKGSLIDEFAKTQGEIKLGKPRVNAFNDMAERIKYLPLNSVINALTTAFQTGGSLAPTLKTISEQFRVERAQAAEKLAQEAPLKLMAPLVLLIFPTIFIILFGPIILTFAAGSLF